MTVHLEKKNVTIKTTYHGDARHFRGKDLINWTGPIAHLKPLHMSSVGGVIALRNRYGNEVSDGATITIKKFKLTMLTGKAMKTSATFKRQP